MCGHSVQDYLLVRGLHVGNDAQDGRGLCHSREAVPSVGPTELLLRDPLVIDALAHAHLPDYFAPCFLQRDNYAGGGFSGALHLAPPLAGARWARLGLPRRFPVSAE